MRYVKLKEEDKGKVIERIKEVLRKEKKVKAAILFGSFTRRNFFNDIDIAVLGELRKSDMDRIANELESRVKLPIDLKRFEELPPKLRYAVVKEGRPILIRDKKSFLRAKRDAIAIYLDMRAFFKRYTMGVLGWSWR